MSWQPVHFLPPVAIQSAFNAAQARLNAEVGKLPGVLESLLKTPIIDVANPEATFFNGPLTGNSSLYGFTQSDLKTVVIHPWVEGVGQGVGHYRYLSSRNAVNAVADKLVDPADDFSPSGDLDYFALLLSGSSYAELGATLDRFLSVYSEPTLYMCARRCAQLATLEDSKQKLPSAAINARWDKATESSSHKWNFYTGEVGHPFSLVNGYDCEGASLEEAVGVVAKKKEAIISQALESAEITLSSIKLGFGKYHVIRFKKPKDAAKILRDSNTNAELPLAVCVVYCGTTDSLNNLMGLFFA
jgi:hypothetical protein